MSQWKITQGDNQFAVSGLAELKAMAQSGNLKAGDMIQPPGTSDWIYASEVPQLASLFQGPTHDDLDAPAGSGGRTMLLAGLFGGVVVLFGGAALYMTQNLPDKHSVLIGDGGLSYSQMIVTMTGQSLRDEPNDRAATKVSVAKDTVLDLLSKRGDFYRARTEAGQEGWIHETAVIPMYQLGGEDVREEYDPLYNPDRYVEVANASWQQLPPEKPKKGAAGEEPAMITVFQFNLWNRARYTMTDIVLQATIKDARGAELTKLEFKVEGEIPRESTTMVGTLKPEDEEQGERRLLTATTFSDLSKNDPDLALRYVDGVEVELGLQDFTNASIDIVELRAVPDEKAKPKVHK